MTENTETIETETENLLRKVFGELINKAADDRDTKKLFGPLMDQFVVVRSDKDGVWMGFLRAVAHQDGSVDRTTVRLEEASLIHSWSSTAATAGLAVRGPGEGSDVSEAVDQKICSDVVGICLATKAARQRVLDIKKWTFEGGAE